MGKYIEPQPNKKSSLLLRNVAMFPRQSISTAIKIESSRRYCRYKQKNDERTLLDININNHFLEEVKGWVRAMIFNKEGELEGSVLAILAILDMRASCILILFFKAAFYFITFSCRLYSSMILGNIFSYYFTFYDIWIFYYSFYLIVLLV